MQKNFLNWDLFVNNLFNNKYKFIKINDIFYLKDVLDWYVISKQDNLSLDFINKYKTYLNWNIISKKNISR